MKLGRKFFIGAFWLPRSSIETLRHTIKALQDKPNVKSPQIFKRLDHNLDPPTYIRLNDFTSAFQEITDTYGVPNYKEVNPSYFGIVTFPFLFGVMFGDIGHGTLLFLFSCFLCLQEKTISRTPLKSFLPYRYLLLLMGFFASF
jgi:V-type H+-transporting ATPase subunit a